MSAKYTCDYCGNSLPDKSNKYQETRHLSKFDNKERIRAIVVCLTIGPVLEEDICNKCFREIRDKFVRELCEKSK